MAFWNWRKKKKEETPQEIPCAHIYKDFPWYIDSSYEEGESTIKIMEPYVCILCGKRQDKVLSHRYRKGLTLKDHRKYIEELTERYPNQIKGTEEVHDMIYDALLVDREKLNILERMRELR